MILAVQIFGLFFGIWFAFLNAVKFFRGATISWQNIAIMAAAWTAFVTAAWLV